MHGAMEYIQKTETTTPSTALADGSDVDVVLGQHHGGRGPILEPDRDVHAAATRHHPPATASAPITRPSRTQEWTAAGTTTPSSLPPAPTFVFTLSVAHLPAVVVESHAVVLEHVLHRLLVHVRAAGAASTSTHACIQVAHYQHWACHNQADLETSHLTPMGCAPTTTTPPAYAVAHTPVVERAALPRAVEEDGPEGQCDGPEEHALLVAEQRQRLHHLPAQPPTCHTSMTTGGHHTDTRPRTGEERMRSPSSYHY